MTLTVTTDGIAQDLTSASAIVLRWFKPGDLVSTDVALTPVNLLTGRLKRVWVSGDTDVVGYHRGRVVVTWPTGDNQSFPNDGSWFYWAVYERDA